MATYRAPGAYARFVKAPTPVVTPAEARALAIVGTGEISYDVVNEAVQRGKSGITDVVKNPGVYKVSTVTSKPLYMKKNVTGSIVYRQGKYEQQTATTAYWDVVDGDYAVVGEKYVVWKKDSAAANRIGSATKRKKYDGSANLHDNLEVQVDIAQDYLLVDATYRIESTFVGSSDGMYVIIKETDAGDEVIGEYVVSSSFNTDAIPGLKIRLTSTAGPATGTNDATLNDYVHFDVKAPKVATSNTFNATTNSLPLSSSAYYVSYSYLKDPNEYGPKVFYSYEDVVTEYGNYDIAANGSVVNSLALGAEIAFLNGAMPVVCVQVQNTESIQQYKKAIDSLSSPIVGLRNVNSIVTLSDHKSDHKDINKHLKEHVETMSLPEEGKERMAYVSSGPTTGENFDSLVNGQQPILDFSSERVIYLAPNKVTKNIKDIRTGVISSKTLNGSYLAVAVAAIGLKNDPAEPLTNKILTGFNNLTNLYTESEMNRLAESGCLVLKQDLNDIRIRHGITTSNVDINSSEITLVQIKDYVMGIVRTNLGLAYIGNKMKPSIVGDIESSLISILNGFQARGIILGYNGVSVKKSPMDARQVDIQFEIEAVYPLNYIDVTFSFSGVN